MNGGYQLSRPKGRRLRQFYHKTQESLGVCETSIVEVTNNGRTGQKSKKQWDSHVHFPFCYHLSSVTWGQGRQGHKVKYCRGKENLRPYPPSFEVGHGLFPPGPDRKSEGFFPREMNSQEKRSVDTESQGRRSEVPPSSPQWSSQRAVRNPWAECAATSHYKVVRAERNTQTNQPTRKRRK